MYIFGYNREFTCFYFLNTRSLSPEEDRGLNLKSLSVEFQSLLHSDLTKLSDRNP